MKNILIENIKNIGQLSFDIPNPGLHILTGTNGKNIINLLNSEEHLDRYAKKKRSVS